MDTTTNRNILDEVELFATRIISQEIPDKMVYHDIKRTHKVIRALNEILEHESLTEEEKEIVSISAWLIHTGFRDVKVYEEEKNPKMDLFSYCLTCSEHIAVSFLKSVNYPGKNIERVVQTIKSTDSNTAVDNRLEMILRDALYYHFGKKGAINELKLMYEENLLTGVISVGKVSWAEMVLGHLEKHHYYTEFGKTQLEPRKQKLIEKIRKEKKNKEKQKDILLKRELDISEAEFKSLKKELTKQKGRDDRGIQTMFRTTSKNHYTLNTMVDRKANIMISVNAIILSLIIGGLVGGDLFLEKRDILPTILMTLTNTLSIFYAVMAIRPEKTHGEFTETEIREKSGNLLFFGNFHNMQFRDYEWGMLQMLSDKNYLYSTMIRDLYYLGETLNRKYKFIRRSLNVFIIGLALTALVTMVVKILQSLGY